MSEGWFDHIRAGWRDTVEPLSAAHEPSSTTT